MVRTSAQKSFESKVNQIVGNAMKFQHGQYGDVTVIATKAECETIGKKFASTEQVIKYHTLNKFAITLYNVLS